MVVRKPSTFEIDARTKPVRPRLVGHRGFTAIQAIPCVGLVLAAIFVAEIGEVDRPAAPAQLAPWTGLTPRHRESDTAIHRGRITKQGLDPGAVGRRRGRPLRRPHRLAEHHEGPDRRTPRTQPFYKITVASACGGARRAARRAG
ncbi:transposase [Dactylosporangium darangshiense]|uniref:Transposase IS116/IS110/IS902 C-terminal domain-containing protein n=1 Tax=Dactylosporangium darangshiense TaxID=579108 RepID=A0ABP8DUK7_9ACTN